ncbi:MAG: acyl carrier protein [Mucilaginibacter sp.]|nr:acyl carrier protein [Mucilaginibacter sp.]
MNDITLRMHQFIEDRLGVERSAIKDSASFYNDLEVDSLDFCELIVDVEKEFDIQIPDDTYEKLKTVGSLVNYVARTINSKLSTVAGMEMLKEEQRLSA